jgi:APA family basic amino acid/polyamine antiporter
VDSPALEPPSLRRNISLPLLLRYGLGTTVGAGIYALMGPVAGSAGGAAPFAFLIAAALAGLTAISFAELSTRYPRSAGEAVYVRKAFGHRPTASGIGLLVALSGSLSAAAIARGFAGYLTALVGLPPALCVFAAILGLALIALWGIRESLVAAAIVTLIEIGGLLLIVWSVRHSLGDLDVRYAELLPGAAGTAWPGVFAGALLAFYAFLGFEDMVNVAEEVKDVRRNLPIAIFGTLGLTTLLYGLVAAASVLAVSPEVLAQSNEPLALVYRSGEYADSSLISVIAMLAMLNGALIQIVMASRVLYGLAGEPFVPARLGRVHPRTGTPHEATALAAAIVLVLALFFPIEELAAATSSITLLVFTAVNAALLRLDWKDPSARAASRVPMAVPMAGFFFNLGFLGYSGWAWLMG